MLSTKYRILFISIAAIVLAVAGWNCRSVKETIPSSADLATDIRLWKMFKQLADIRRDIEKTISQKDLTFHDAELCFKRHEKTLKEISARLAEFKEQDTAYSPHLQKLASTMEQALKIAKETCRNKRISSIKDTRITIETLGRLSRELPVKRTRYLLHKGCSCEQIYEIFRSDGFKDDDIQDFILEAMESESTPP
ncbi:hypothetical protein IJT17_02625 [bacterium]|nr:hypothetical protein [bacterium]